MTIVNGIVAFSESFEPSGPWCFDGGSPAIKTLQMRLEKGANLLEFRPTGAEAPIIDKIVVREPAHGDAEAVVKVSGNAREFDDEPTIASTALSETEEFVGSCRITYDIPLGAQVAAAFRLVYQAD